MLSPSSVLLLFAALATLSCSTLAKETFTLGLYGSDKPSAMVRQFKPITKILEKDISAALNKEIKIKIRVASSYQKGIDSLVQGNVDFARLGPASFVLADKQNPNIKIMALEKNKEGKKVSGVLAVKHDSSINSLADLKGKSFAFGSESSTTGRFFAQYELQKANVFSSDLMGFKYLGRHDRVATAILSGQYDAGSFKIATYEKLVKKGEKFKVLLTYPLLFKPWVAKEGLDDNVFNAIKAALLKFDQPKLKPSAFQVGDKSDFSFTKNTIEKNHLFWSKPK